MIPRRKLFLLTSVLLCFLAGGALVYKWLGTERISTARTRSKPPQYLSVTADRGVVARVINASGTLNPLNTIQVGTQASGRITALHADFNSPVRKGQLLAELDQTAQLADLQANQANLRKLQANLALYEAELKRSSQLIGQGYVSQSDHDQSVEKRDVARAAVDQQLATIARIRLNVGYTKIYSPVSGTVLAREVSVGQTVQASFSAPVLFRIAEDLKRMQIEAAIPEADIGLLAVGQQVEFSVDAFPDQRFNAKIRQLRNNYAVQQNVVTYSAIMDAANEDLLLRPGMTAYLRIEVARREQVLRVPNAALRYASSQQTSAVGSSSQTRQRTLLRLAPDQQAQLVEVRTGLTDAAYTELLDSKIKPGDAVVIGVRPTGGFQGPKIF